MDSSARTINGNIADTGDLNFDITETLGDSSNSPSTTSLLLSVVASSVPEVFSQINVTPEDAADTFVSAELFFEAVMPEFIATIYPTPENAADTFVSAEIGTV